MDGAVVTGELHQISRVIGNLEAGVDGLRRTFEQHAHDDDRRHEENVTTLRSIARQVGELNECLTPLAKTVKEMEPVLTAIQTSRLKLAGAFGLLAVLATGFVWVLSKTISSIVPWLLSFVMTGKA